MNNVRTLFSLVLTRQLGSSQLVQLYQAQKSTPSERYSLPCFNSTTRLIAACSAVSSTKMNNVRTLFSLVLTQQLGSSQLVQLYQAQKSTPSVRYSLPCFNSTTRLIAACSAVSSTKMNTVRTLFSLVLTRQLGSSQLVQLYQAQK